MNEKEFQARHSEVLESLRAARGDCPDADALLDWIAGVVEGERGEAIERHVNLCSECADIVERARQPETQVDDLSWQRTAKRLDARAEAWSPSRSRRAGWLAAAAAVAAAVLILVYRPGEQPAPPDIALTRDAGITLLDPRGPVNSVESFRWQGIPAPVTYRIEVDTIGGSKAPLWQGTTTDTRLRADDALLAALEGQQGLQWRVVVLDDEGQELAHSDWTAFELAH